jgi:hypothetical protein
MPTIRTLFKPQEVLIMLVSRRPHSRSIPLAISASTTVLLVTLLSPAAQAAAPIHGPKALNDTGAQQCWRNDVPSTDCKNTGQDADAGRDVSKPDDSNGHAGFSFSKVCNSGEAAGKGNCPADPVLGSGPNDWACTLDKVTDLMWEIKTTDGGLRDRLHTYTNWGDGRPGDASDFAKQVNQIGLCGHNDWRVPTVIERHSIIDYGSPDFMDSNFIPYSSYSQWTRNSSVWSSAWDVGSYGGGIMRRDPDTQVWVQLVRKGTTIPADDQRYVVNGIEAYDTYTGLTWRTCNEPCGEGGVNNMLYTYKQAFKRAKQVAKATGQKWRVPNVKELWSIINPDNPANVDPNVFKIGVPLDIHPTSPIPSYITSTPYFEDRPNSYFGVAIYTNYEKPSAGVGGKGLPRYLVLVK